jgi:hypothetical protein
MLTLVLLIILVPLALLAGYMFLQNRKSKIKNLPQPKVANPFLGNLPEILANFDRRYDYFVELFEKLGPTITITAPQITNGSVVTTDPIIVEHVLKSGFENYEKG